MIIRIVWISTDTAQKMLPCTIDGGFKKDCLFAADKLGTFQGPERMPA